MNVGYRLFLMCAMVSLLLSTAPPAPEGEGQAMLKEQAIALKDLLRKARSDSGQELWACPSVEDDKVSVLVEAGNTVKLVRMLDLLPGYQWVEATSTDGGKAYVLGPDWEERELWRKRAEQDEVARDEGYQEQLRRQQAALAERLEQAFDALSVSEEEIWRREDEDPPLVWALTGYRRPIMEYLAGLPREERRRISEWVPGYEVPDVSHLQVPFSELPIQCREAIGAAQRRSATMLGEADAAVDEEPLWVRFAGGNTDLYVLTGYATEYGQPKTDEFLLFGRYKHLRYKPMLIWEAGLAAGKSREEIGLEVRGVLREELGKHDIEMEAERDAELGRLPPRFGTRHTVPNATLEQAPPVHWSKMTAEALAQLAGSYALINLCQRNGIGFAAQYTDRDYVAVPSTSGKTEFYKAVDRMAGVDWVWAYEDGSAEEIKSAWPPSLGPVVLVASKEFVEELGCGTPTHLVKMWRQRAASQGGVLTLDELAEIAASKLSDEQVERLPLELKRAGTSVFLSFWYDPETWTGGGGSRSPARPDLRFYASLDAPQREAAWGKKGLAYDAMSIAQRRLFDVAAFGEYQPWREGVSPQAFCVSRKGEQVVFTYSLSGWPDCVGSWTIREPRPALADAGSAGEELPAAVRAAMSLSDWTYVGRYDREGKVRAILQQGVGDWKERIVVPEGATFRGAQLTSIESKSLTFTADDGTTIKLLPRRAVSLRPYLIRPAQ